jgi:hypothetical protein
MILGVATIGLSCRPVGAGGREPRGGIAYGVGFMSATALLRPAGIGIGS